MALCSPCDNEKLGPILNRLLDCLAASMQNCDADPCRLFLSTDSVVPWDVCCACGDGIGQAWVNVSLITPLLDDNQRGTACPPIFEATVKVGILRCAYTQDDAGNPPDPCDLTDQALSILRDRAIINYAIFGCFADTIESDDWTIGDWSGLGPQGGCVGGQVSLTIRFNG